MDHPDELRAAERAWLTQHQQEHAGKWVAIQDGELIASGSSLHDVLQMAKQLGHQQPLTVHIPEHDTPFGGW